MIVGSGREHGARAVYRWRRERDGSGRRAVRALRDDVKRSLAFYGAEIVIEVDDVDGFARPGTRPRATAGRPGPRPHCPGGQSAFRLIDRGGYYVRVTSTG